MKTLIILVALFAVLGYKTVYGEDVSFAKDVALGTYVGDAPTTAIFRDGQLVTQPQDDPDIKATASVVLDITTGLGVVACLFDHKCGTDGIGFVTGGVGATALMLRF